MPNTTADNRRQFPRYGERRNEDTNVEETMVLREILDYEQRVPERTDMRMDVGQSLNSAIVRSWSDSDLIAKDQRPEVIGQTPSRENYEHSGAGLIDAHSITRRVDPATVDLCGPGMLGINPCLLRDAISLGLASSSNRNVPASQAMTDHLNQLALGTAPVRAANNGSRVANGGWIAGHPLTAPLNGAGATPDGIGPFGLWTNNLDYMRGTGEMMPPKKLVQLLLTGNVQTDSFSTQESLTFAFLDENPHTQSDAGTGGMALPWSETLKMFTMDGATRETYANSDASELLQSADETREALSYCVKKMMYTSFYDFVIDFYDAFEKLFQNLVYLKGEFVGFFERGMKAEFWQKFNLRELTVMCWSIQLGMAMRRGQWANNLHNIAPLVKDDQGNVVTASGSTFSGVWHPLYTKLDGIDFTAISPLDMVGAAQSTHTEWCAPGLQRYIDELNYAPAASVAPERNMYTADLLTGLDVILREASRELGLATRSIGRGVTEFFESFKEGVTTSIRGESDRVDLEALKNIWHLGFDRTTGIQNTVGSAQNHHVTWASSFSDVGGIIDHDAQTRFIRDVETQAKEEYLMCDTFNAGMMTAGTSSSRISHKSDINGKDYSLELNFDPDSQCRLINFRTTWTSNNAKLTKDDPDYPEHPVWPKAKRIVAGWPSVGQGWHVYSKYVYHPLCGILPGSYESLQAAHIDSGYGTGYGHICFPDGRLPVVQRYNYIDNAFLQITDSGLTYYMTPLFGNVYYDVSVDGPFAQAMTHMSRLNTLWNGTADDVPFKSGWSPIGSMEGVNLIAKLTLSTGEALVQSNLNTIWHGSSCGSSITVNRPVMTMSRLYDRQLADQTIHNPPLRTQDEDFGIDSIAMILGEGVDPTTWLNSQAMYHWLLYQNGRLSTHYMTPLNTAYYPTGMTMAFGNYGSMMLDWVSSNLTNSPVAGARGYGSNLRTYFTNPDETLIDGTVREKIVTPLFDVGALTITADGIRNPACFVSSLTAIGASTVSAETGVTVFDYYDEDLVREFSVVNAAHCSPGHRWYFEALYSLDPTQPASLDNSPCSAMGMRDSLAAAGSRTALSGFGRHSNEIVTTVNAFRNELGLVERPQLTSGLGNDIELWSTDLWSEYLNYGRGLELGGDTAYNTLQLRANLRNRYPFSVLVIDQDILDYFSMWETLHSFLNMRNIDMYVPTHFVLTTAGALSYFRGSDSSQSSGGVVTSTGFTESSDSYETGDAPAPSE